MHRVLPVSLALLLLLLAAPAVAQDEVEPLTGQAAPEFGKVEWVMNVDEPPSIAALKGDVVLVEYWGVQ